MSFIGNGDGVDERCAHLIHPFYVPRFVVERHDEAVFIAAIHGAIIDGQHGRGVLVAKATVGGPQLFGLGASGLVAHNTVLHGLGKDVRHSVFPSFRPIAVRARCGSAMKIASLLATGHTCAGE